jgi:hypothetical protein
MRDRERRLRAARRRLRGRWTCRWCACRRSRPRCGRRCVATRDRDRPVSCGRAVGPSGVSCRFGRSPSVSERRAAVAIAAAAAISSAKRRPRRGRPRFGTAVVARRGGLRGSAAALVGAAAGVSKRPASFGVFGCGSTRFHPLDDKTRGGCPSAEGDAAEEREGGPVSGPPSESNRAVRPECARRGASA